MDAESTDAVWAVWLGLRDRGLADQSETGPGDESKLRRASLGDWQWRGLAFSIVSRICFTIHDTVCLCTGIGSPDLVTIDPPWLMPHEISLSGKKGHDRCRPYYRAPRMKHRPCNRSQDQGLETGTTVCFTVCLFIKPGLKFRQVQAHTTYHKPITDHRTPKMKHITCALHFRHFFRHSSLH